MKKSLLLLVTLLASLSAWAGEVTVNIVGNGTVDVTYNGSTTEQNISSGWEMNLSGSLTLTMTPAQGYTLQELQMVTLIGSSTESTTENNGVFTYTIGRVGINTITYTVVFSQAGTPTYTLSGPDGMIFSVGGETVTLAEEGQRVDITLPAPGNHSYWVVSSSDASIQQDDANHFHFTMPAKSVIVNAQQYSQTAHFVIDESTHGQVMVNGKEPGTEGHYADETITLTPIPDEGYEYLSGSLTATNNLSNEAIDLTGNGDGTWSFTMPGAQVTVSATFKKAPVITSYVDADGTEYTTEAIPLDETMTSLGAEGQESWYVACDTLNYTQALTIAGDVHLILADGAVMNIMNIGTETAPRGGYGINGNEHEETTLTIYGQTLDDDTAGHLNINSDYDCIYINGDYAQHGGNVTANSTYWSGIALWNNLTLTGGTLYVTSSKKAINTVENVDILGGKFSAIGGDKGIYTMEGDVTLGWKNADDEITISSLAYDAPRCTMKIIDGQAFTDSVKNIYDSTTPSVVLWALTNVTLRPLRYTFNSTTGELKLLWGPFYYGNKWGDDVTPSAVKSVTATSNVSFTGDCTELFNGFSSCTSMDLGNVNTENCNNMSGMFRSCESLKTLDLSSWDTGSVIFMAGMFHGCRSLETLDLSGWNTSRVEYMNGMFQGCSSFKMLDLSGWNTRRVNSMNGMFRECWSLETLDLSGWDTGNVTIMSEMFSNCKKLTTIYVGDGWSTESITGSEEMFNGCTKLVGGMGTTYDENHIDAEYAHIDGGTDNPGYLTGLFSITLPESVEHGTLSASQGDKVLVNGDKVINGSTVTLTVAPDNGYELDALTVTYTNDGGSSGAPMRLRGGTVELTPGENGTYTFQMPAAPLAVNATFKKTKVTGLNDINAAQPRSGQRYNMLGQPVGKDYRGIVIEDGRKIYVE